MAVSEERPSSRELRSKGRHLWAKSSEDGVGHSLLAHSLDTGSTAERLLARKMIPMDGIASELGVSCDAAQRWFVTLAALHDLGKATPAFQRLWPAGAPTEANVDVTNVPHGKATILLLADALSRRGFGRRLCRAIAHAVGIHHGRNVASNEIEPGVIDERALGSGSEPWETWRDAICDDVIAAFAPGPVPSGKRLPSARTWALLAGLTSVADWIASSLPHAGIVTDVDAYHQERRIMIDARLNEIGFPPGERWWKPPASDDVAAWFAAGGSFSPRPLQTAMLEAFTANANPGLIILEAPTGEGKTEAALLGMVRIDARQGAYFGLPTQATSNAMAARIEAFKERHRARDVVLALAHAGARVRQAASVNAVDESGIESDATASAWFSSGRRELLAELGVGTIDQALLAILPTKHHFVRLFALAGRTLIVDEVHAYDTYTGGLLESLVTWAAALNVRVILMSATLPAATRRRLTTAYQQGIGSGDAHAAATDAPPTAATTYPRITVVDAQGGVSARSFAAVRRTSIAFEEAPYDPQALTNEIVEAAAAGGAIGVIVNTVHRAQTITRALIERGIHPLLLHARFPAHTRRALEQAILARLGPHGHGDERAGIYVGTQVLEQSLDIDFDALFTDLAPIDLLLQRAGRLHRHGGRSRPPSHAAAKLRIAGHAADAPDQAALDGIYSHARSWRTWAALRQQAGIIVQPDDVDPLVQSVYGDTPLQALHEHESAYGETLRTEAQEAETDERIAERWRIPSPHEAASAAWTKSFAEEHEARPYAARARTRLGEASLDVIPVIADSGGWRVLGGRAVQRLEAKRPDAAWIDEALDARIRIQRRDLLQALIAASTPGFWTRSGPLAFMKPLLLDGSSRAVVWKRARLDPILGLVFERS
jgi:CRISPR-associated endonuclease/helicase Cas3